MRDDHPRKGLCGILAILWAVWSAQAAAGTLQVNPVLVAVDTDRRTASITVTNADPNRVTIRVHALSWRQPAGEDICEETSDVIVSPPIFSVAPGASQVIRVGLRNPAAAHKAYRLIIEEVPEASPGAGIRIALRLNLPFFAMIQPGQDAALRWTAWREATGTWMLQAANAGTGYVRIDPAMATAATGLRFDETTYLGTVLPGALRRWSLGNELSIENQSIVQQILRAEDRAEVRSASRRR